ncbi:MAG: hypothetical protein M3069_05880 [Chloroflexota bacterium]|nr:hypothetical protein [Chloroflexota bacterium]
MRLRFEQRELALLRGAEQVRGAALARTPRPDDLRTGLSLARAGRKLASAAPGASVSLEENEVKLLLAALRYTTDELQRTSRANDGQSSRARESVSAAFAELVELGGWRSFGLTRELEALAARLQTALSS